MSKKYPRPCFWCGLMLTRAERTRDHLLSRYLRRRFKSNTPCVSACKKCNGTRGSISYVFEFIHRHSRQVWDERPMDEEKITDLVRRLFQRVAAFDVLRFREVIEDKICCDRHKLLCLMEIDQVITFARKHKILLN